MRVLHYLSPDGKDVFQRWLDQLSDQRARSRILRRIDRIELDGFLGDHKYVRDGVSELRVDEGAGYRVYFGRRASGHWKDYKDRTPS